MGGCSSSGQGLEVPILRSLGQRVWLHYITQAQWCRDVWTQSCWGATETPPGCVPGIKAFWGLNSEPWWCQVCTPMFTVISLVSVFPFKSLAQEHTILYTTQIIFFDRQDDTQVTLEGEHSSFGRGEKWEENFSPLFVFYHVPLSLLSGNKNKFNSKKEKKKKKKRVQGEDVFETLIPSEQLF